MRRRVRRGSSRTTTATWRATSPACGRATGTASPGPAEHPVRQSPSTSAKGLRVDRVWCAVGRWTAAAAAVLMIVVVGAGPAPAAPADEVYAALGIDRVPADYVLMVDVSSSMGGARYTALKRSLTAFLAALA